MARKLLLFFVIMLCLFLFLRIADLPQLYFLNDDNFFIPASRYFRFLYGTSFRPVSDLTLFTDYTCWHTHAMGYHITNFFLHLLTTVLVFFLANKIFTGYDVIKAGYLKALLVAVLFFFYPFHSEAIFWIIGRGGLLGALFGTASLFLYLNREKSRWYEVAAILAFVTGAFAYETVWIVPPIVLVITYFDIRQCPVQKKASIRSAAVFWAFFLLYLILRSNITGELTGSPYGNSGIIKFSVALWIKNYNIMVARSFLPPLQSTALLIVLYCLLLLLFLFLSRKLIVQRRLSPGILIAAAGFMISFLPVLTLGVDSHDSESERFLYFPSVFAVILITQVIFELVRSVPQRSLLFLVLLSAEIFFLSKAARVYQISSKVAWVSMKAVDSINSRGTLYCIDLPTQYKGGLIYRNGFNASVAWLAGNNKATIIIVSAKEMVNPSLQYPVRHLTLNDLPPPEAAAVLKQLPLQQSFGYNDIILKWTDAALLVIK